MLNPSFEREKIATLDTVPVYARGVDGSDYMPGLIGLNNIKNTDFVNVVVQSLARVPPLRDFFLLPSNYERYQRSALVREFGALVRKMWSPYAARNSLRRNFRRRNSAVQFSETPPHHRSSRYNFKGQVSPHELLQACMHASGSRYRIGVQSDPMDFLAWLLNALHTALGGTKAAGSSIIHTTFQGTVEVTTRSAAAAAAFDEAQAAGEAPPPEAAGDTKTVPFLYLTVDVPAAPLFKDALERNIIPQVPLVSCLTKFDGTSFQEMMNGDRRQYVITKLPKYLVVHIKRFSKNTQQFVEKNPTIVNFPVRNLEMGPYARLAVGEREKGTKYHLMCSTQHDGPPEGGTYRTFVHFKSNDQWYEVQDLHVNNVHPQLISVSESYIQFYDAAQS